jgi:hypothetical protein
MLIIPDYEQPSRFRIAVFTTSFGLCHCPLRQREKARARSSWLLVLPWGPGRGNKLLPSGGFADMDAFDALVLAHVNNCTDTTCVWCGSDLLAIHDEVSSERE